MINLDYFCVGESIARKNRLACPSHHWSLSHLGERFHEWVEEFYEGKDKKILLDAIAIDWAYQMCFFEGHLPHLTVGANEGEDLSRLLSQKVTLQPHLYLFCLDYDLFSFRREIKEKDPDFWSSHHYPDLDHALDDDNSHFPKLKKDGPYAFVIYRTPRNTVVGNEISVAEYMFLMQFREGKSVEEVLDWVVESGGEYLPEVSKNLEGWMKKWVAEQFFARVG